MVTVTNPGQSNLKPNLFIPRRSTDMELEDIKTNFLAIQQWADIVMAPAGGQPLRFSTKVVAASNSLDNTATHYDYLCTGTNDQVTIQAALTAAHTTGGQVLLMEGDYYLQGASVGSGALVWSKTGLSLVGMGKNTILHFDVSGSVWQGIVCNADHGRVENLWLDVVGDGATKTIGLFAGGQNILFRGLRITGTNLFGAGANVNDGSQGIVTNDYTMVENVDITNWAAAAGNNVIGLITGGNYGAIRRVQIQGPLGSTGTRSCGILVGTNNNTVEDCIVYGPVCQGGGVSIVGGSGGANTGQRNILRGVRVLFASYDGIQINSRDTSTGGDNLIEGCYVEASSQNANNTNDNYVLSGTRNVFQHNISRPQTVTLTGQPRYGLNIDVNALNDIAVNNDLNAAGGAWGTAAYHNAGAGTLANLDGSANNWNRQ